MRAVIIFYYCKTDTYADNRQKWPAHFKINLWTTNVIWNKPPLTFIHRALNMEAEWVMSILEYVVAKLPSNSILFLPAWSAICLRVAASFNWAWIWARSSCIFFQLSWYWRRTSSMMVVVKARPTKMYIMQTNMYTVFPWPVISAINERNQNMIVGDNRLARNY